MCIRDRFQLGYILGEQTLDAALKAYYDQWKFKHPDKYDFIRALERTADLELDWFFDLWINTTKTIDYGVEDLIEKEDLTQISLRKIGEIPMPIDLLITKKDGSQLLYYIPLGIMRGEKSNESSMARVVARDWYWTHPSYQLEVPVTIDEIAKVEIDPSGRMADISRQNNVFKTK